VNKPVAQVDQQLSMATTHARTQRQHDIHQLYLLDLGPPDFLLFWHLQHCLGGQSFGATDEPFLAVNAVLRTIEK
jgi:hypothetical protein